MNKAPGRLPFAVRAAVAVAGPVLVATLVGDVSLGLMAGLGSFTVLFGANTAGRFRARLLPTVGLGLTLSAALGVATPWQRRRPTSPRGCGRTSRRSWPSPTWAMRSWGCWQPNSVRAREAAGRVPQALTRITRLPVTEYRDPVSLRDDVLAAAAELWEWRTDEHPQDPPTRSL
ncbi:hypothetical protein ACFQ06_13560 [Tessaracoccus lubricantis]